MAEIELKRGNAELSRRYLDRSLPATAKLAAFTILAAPVRLMVLALAMLLIAVASTIAFAALITISLAFIALVSCRVVLPEADRLADHLTPNVADDPSADASGTGTGTR